MTGAFQSACCGCVNGASCGVQHDPAFDFGVFVPFATPPGAGGLW